MSCERGVYHETESYRPAIMLHETTMPPKYHGWLVQHDLIILYLPPRRAQEKCILREVSF